MFHGHFRGTSEGADLEVSEAFRRVSGGSGSTYVVVTGAFEGVSGGLKG